MRGSDPDAAVYYVASMLAGGEDPKFIARRMIVFASEDVGNADPMALQVAIAASRAVEFVGLPECRINLSQAAVYLALAHEEQRFLSCHRRRSCRCTARRQPAASAPPSRRQLPRGEGTRTRQGV